MGFLAGSEHEKVVMVVNVVVKNRTTTGTTKDNIFFKAEPWSYYVVGKSLRRARHHCLVICLYFVSFII